MAALIRALDVVISDDQLERISRDNPGWKIERLDDGALRVSPTSTPGGAKSGEAFGQLRDYAKRVGGKAYDSSTGFKTPRSGVVSPDAAWIRAERVAAFAGDVGYWQMMPDVIIEIASRSDAWPEVCAKIDRYLSDGAPYAIAIDPHARSVYARGSAPTDLTLDIDAIIDA